MGTVEIGSEWRHHIPTRSIGGALYAPFNLPLVLLPLRQGFALSWWLPFAVAALALYAWLRLLGVQSVVALAGGLLVTTAPAAVWWSTWIVLPIACAAAPCALLLWGVRLWPTRPRLAIIVGLSSGLAAAGLPWTYQPFAIPVALFTGGVSLLWLMADHGRRRAVFRVGAVAGAVFLVESVLWYLHERDYFTALGDTVYPGARRALGGGLPLGRLFSSLFPFVLAGPRGQSLVPSTNLTEISMGWTMALPAALGALLLARKSLRQDADRLVLYGTAVLCLVLSSWPLVRWPPIVAKLSLMTLSPPERTAFYVGYFGVVLLALVLGTTDRRRALAIAARPKHVAALGLGAAALAFVAAVQFRWTYLPDLPTTQILIAVTVTGILSAAIVTRRSTAALMVATMLSLTSGAVVNPLQQGLGEIDDSPAAQLVRQVNREVVAPRGGRWAADSLAAGGLLNGQGVDSLSSFNDPVQPAGWQVIDPHKQFEREWNRFAHIAFEWVPGAKPTVVSPQTDVVKVIIDPCDPRLSELRLTLVVSTRTLTESACLRELGRVQWQGPFLTLYERMSGTE